MLPLPTTESAGPVNGRRPVAESEPQPERTTEVSASPAKDVRQALRAERERRAKRAKRTNLCIDIREEKVKPPRGINGQSARQPRVPRTLR